jgi:uncharacterized protein (TIGR02266 family)
MKKTVLIAEDEEQVRHLLKATLSTQGFEVIQAANGEEAVEKFFQAPLDAVIMDLNMPQMDGCEAIKQIRLLEGGKEIPIVVLTALDSKDWHEKAEKAGASLFMTKPFKPKDVIHCLRTLLEPIPEPKAKRSKKSTFNPKTLNFKVRYKTEEGFLNCYLRNLLENRSFLETNKPLPLGSKFNFEIMPPNEEKGFTVIGTVKWVNLYAGQKGMGVQFSFKDKADETRIHKYVLEMEQSKTP